MPERRVVVPDSGVILQAALHPQGPAGRFLRLLDEGAFIAYLSSQTRDEIEDVLARPAIRSRYPHLTDDRARSLLERLDSRCLVVAITTRYVEYPRDPDDEPILNLAIHVGADYLVTRDRDLLDLAHSRDFRLIYHSLRIVSPVTFLRIVSADETK